MVVELVVCSTRITYSLVLTDTFGLLSVFYTKNLHIIGKQIPFKENKIFVSFCGLFYIFCFYKCYTLTYRPITIMENTSFGREREGTPSTSLQRARYAQEL